MILRIRDKGFYLQNNCYIAVHHKYTLQYYMNSVN
jgi:hypothetical protein